MNKNINGHNGKEIPRDQNKKNIRKEGETQPVDKIRRKKPSRPKEIHPDEAKKATVNQHKNQSNPAKSDNRSRVIKLKEKGITPVETPIKKEISQEVDPFKTSKNGNAAPVANTLITTDSQSSKKAKREIPNMGTYLYVIAAILVVGWVIAYFFYDLGNNTHLLLAMALLAGLIGFYQDRKKKQP